MSPMRLLIVSASFPVESSPSDGVFVARQAGLLARQGLEVHVLVPRLVLPAALRRFTRWPGHSDPKLLPPPRVAVHRAWYFRPPGARFAPITGLLKAPSALWVARTLHARQPFDAVLGIDMTSDAVAAVYVGHVLGLPVASLAIGSDVMTRAPSDSRLARLLGDTLAQVALPMGVSRAVCRQLEATGRCTREPVCIYLGRDATPAFEPGQRMSVRRELGLSDDALVAVFVGRLTREKGMADLVRAAGPLLARHPRLALLCVGDGPEAGALARLGAESGRGSAVCLPGRVPPAAVARYLAAADFMVFPSHDEGLPQAVLEAMDAGLAIVATRVGGIPEAVLHEETGLLVPARDPAALGHAMERMLTDDVFRRAAATRSAARARQVFDSDANARAMADALRGLVGRG